MIQENIVIGQGTKFPLNGRLTMPDQAAGPLPAVVLVHGSGASNMDEKVGRLTPFKDLAEGLAEHGVACLRYDKRSFAHGFKLLREKEVTVWKETIEDALLATQLLRQDPRIDPERIYLLGHSMGAMLAPRIHAEGGQYAGLILMAGSPRRLEEIMADQNEAAFAQMNPLMQKIAGKQIRKMMALFEGMYEMTDEEAKTKKMGGGTTLYYFKEMGEHAAPGYLAGLDKPLLILQGQMDFQATLEKDFAAYQALVGDRNNVTMKVYEGLNHAFVPSIYGKNIMKARQEYNVERHIGHEVIGDIAGWIHGLV